MSSVVRLAVVVLAVLAAGCGSTPHASLSVNASSGYADSPVSVVVHASGKATLHASWTNLNGDVWRSSVPLGPGTATVRASRFLTAMRPTEAPFKDPAFFPPPTGPSPVALSVVAGGKTIARATVSRRVTPPSVRVRHFTVRGDGIEAFLFMPRVRGRRSAVVAFGGSEGRNSMFDVAATLARHGYPALALAYFHEPGLPQELRDIPLEYFARAVRTLDRQPGVDRRHVVVMGHSRGGELALLLASTFPRLIHGAVGLVPSANVWPAPAANLDAWTLHGKGIRPRPIRVERIRGPVLTAGAGDDRVWASGPSVRTIERRLRAHRFRFFHAGVVYPRAGHLIGDPLPYQPAATDASSFGGTPGLNEAAREDLWPRILRYFARL
jgi:dienelactone hydrolase